MASFPTEEGMNMTHPIHWQAFLQVSSREKAERLLSRLGQAIGQEIPIGECERYWKDASLCRVTFTSWLPGADLAPAVVEMLRVASQIAGRWIVGAPQLYEGGQWEFAGTAVNQTIAIPGVTDIDFRVGTVAPSEPEAVSRSGESHR
jgi:hypothetical protein